MGGSTSKTAINELSETISNISSNIVQNCEVVATQSQVINANNTGISFWTSYKLEQKTDINSQCFSDVAKEQQLQNEIIAAISQKTTTDGVALLDAFSSPNATAEANLSNIVRNNITMSNIQNNYNSMKQTQEANFNNSGIVAFQQADLIQGSKLFAASTLNIMDKTGIFDKISTHIDQTATAKSTNPLQFIADVVSGITGGIVSGIAGVAFMFIFFIIMIIGGIYLAINLLGGSAKAATTRLNSPTYQKTQPVNSQISTENEPVKVPSDTE